MFLETLPSEIELLEGYPYIYIRDNGGILVGADYHLGYEVVLAEEEGYYVPQSQFEIIIEELEKLVNEKKPRIFVVNGDLKHKFSRRTRQETKEITQFLDFASEKVEKTFVIRGNHDNFVRGLFENYPNIEFVDDYIVMGDYLFTHGHIINEEIIRQGEGKTVIIGHEHPALLLYDDIGGKMKIPAILIGKTDFNANIIVLPAVSPLMSGIEANITPQNEFLSPYLKLHVNIDHLTPIGIVRGKENLRFPSIGIMKEIQGTL